MWNWSILCRNLDCLLTWESKFERVPEFGRLEKSKVKWFVGESLKFQRLKTKTNKFSCGDWWGGWQCHTLDFQLKWLIQAIKGAARDRIKLRCNKSWLAPLPSDDSDRCLSALSCVVMMICSHLIIFLPCFSPSFSTLIND